jgi:hypothetical protein
MLVNGMAAATGATTLAISGAALMISDGSMQFPRNVVESSLLSHEQIPSRTESQVLPGMQGRLWIDKKTFQWVKVTARVISPVSIEGILAKVERGTYFELENMPVAEGVWLTPENH